MGFSATGEDFPFKSWMARIWIVEGHKTHKSLRWLRYSEYVYSLVFVLHDNCNKWYIRTQMDAKVLVCNYHMYFR